VHLPARILNAVVLHSDRSEYFFRIIDLLRSLPIIAALRSVGGFSRAFSETLDERLI
jgi:hypothetical protein